MSKQIPLAAKEFIIERAKKNPLLKGMETNMALRELMDDYKNQFIEVANGKAVLELGDKTLEELAKWVEDNTSSKTAWGGILYGELAEKIRSLKEKI